MSKSRTANQILLEKRSALVNGVPRGMTDGDLSGAPVLDEAATIYWKSVSKKFPVSMKGKDYFAKMPDGLQKVSWKPAEAAEAKKHLDGLMGKKESAELDEAAIEALRDEGSSDAETLADDLESMLSGELDEKELDEFGPEARAAALAARRKKGGGPKGPGEARADFAKRRRQKILTKKKALDKRASEDPDFAKKRAIKKLTKDMAMTKDPRLKLAIRKRINRLQKKESIENGLRSPNKTLLEKRLREE